ncbi:MAG: 16S rRNA (guanine(527)-N(7))-methyltransferase RsmG [Ruminococcus flavefaciens]|nr:16S rRNA (guanine(527)-N(7))-methyltransferase RsmG [Ruminococcus flavefaciens]MCM1360541.1 16S rRNA (guanine(527)-N(7))-methyltransferase RsmG [Clostridiales bacterium]MCM1435860.1 16S rRNA (guanine(527)-N(7))-methyltransferase RsmG [Ruminococcus flavefaciens]
MFPDFEICCSAFEKYGLSLDKHIYDKLSIYCDFLIEYNKNVNLTAITDPVDILYKHFIDSIIMVKYVNIPQNACLIDIGTGAGFPSIPLKIYRPDINLTLLDSLNKRITFLQLLCEKIGIKAEFIHGRAEDFSKKPEYREKFDVSCARAVANMSLLSELCIPFVKVGGKFVSMKGPNEDISLGFNAIKILGGNVSRETNYSLENEERRIVQIEKISQTPTKYPRNSSQIKKKLL